jgi:hypothetical protein
MGYTSRCACGGGGALGGCIKVVRKLGRLDPDCKEALERTLRDTTISEENAAVIKAKLSVDADHRNHQLTLQRSLTDRRMAEFQERRRDKLARRTQVRVHNDSIFQLSN